MSRTGPLVDETVATWAARLVAPTRHTDPVEVAALRSAVSDDLPRVDRAARAWARLGADLPPTQARVVGRVTWVRANLASLRGAFDPLADRLRGSRVVASRVLGGQLGILLGLLSAKVIGQYVLPLGGPGGGQLLVVGPNLLDLAAERGPLADDVRRSVLLHEVTHRLQFDGVAWLGDHLRGLLDRYLGAARVDPAALVEAATRLPDAISHARATGTVTPLLEVVLTPDQVAIVDEAQGMMSLLEGHGNAAMSAAGQEVVRDPDAVRQALQQRRDDVTTRLLRGIAGLEMKKRQYVEGEAFVHAVVAERGIDGLNIAFTAPDRLPTPKEIREPGTWLSRVPQP